MNAGDEAAAHSYGRMIVTYRRRDKDLVRTVGVLTKAGLSDGKYTLHTESISNAKRILCSESCLH